MRLPAIPLACSIFLFATHVQAADKCDGKPSMQEHVECSQALFEARQRELKGALGKLRARIKAGAQDPGNGIDGIAVEKSLAAAQQQWQRYVENDCKAQMLYVGSGTARNVVELNCMIRHYEQRIREMPKWGEE